MSVRPFPLSRLLALGLTAVLAWPVPAHGALIGTRAPTSFLAPADKIVIASACWILPGSPLAVAKIRATAPKVRSVNRAHRSARGARHVHRHRLPARSWPVRSTAPKVQCDLFEPETEIIEPFAETMARMMMPVATDELAIQKLMQKRYRRLRRRPAARPPVSAAPEPATWLMLVGGFAAIGWWMRRSRRDRHAQPVACSGGS